MALNNNVKPAVCVCGHLDHWHSHGGAGACEHDGACKCEHFHARGEPLLADPVREKLHGALDQALNELGLCGTTFLLVPQPPRLTDDQIREDVQTELDDMFGRLADKWDLKSGDVDPMMTLKWEEETVPEILRYIRHWYHGNQPTEQRLRETGSLCGLPYTSPKPYDPAHEGHS